MNKLKLPLMSAAAAVALCAANGAQATTVVYPTAEIDGNGSSAISIVITQTLDCLGGTNTPLGFGNGTTQTIPTHDYVPVSPTTANPVYHCSTQSVQPNITGYYISTGSGGGKTNWSQFIGTTGITTNPFGSWPHVQYAMSDSAVSTTNLSDYHTNAEVAHNTGPAIQIPFYVLPVAISYSPIYGKRDTGSGVVNLAFNVKSTFVQKDGAGNPIGGLRMKKTTYCGIMNGNITNWNDPALKADNGGQSLMDPADDTTRWNTTGVPIRLVGRSDNSGTTNVFSRHLAAVCTGSDFSGLGGNDQLPSARKGTAVYDKTTGNLTSGSETSGKFGLADGNDGVAHVVGHAIPTPTGGATNLNGAIGYNGADWVLPATLSGTNLFSAALQQGTTTAFKMANATNATAAFGTAYLPPQSASTGKYDPSVTANGNRNDPNAWVLHASATTGLANPAKGYPIVGTTNALFYTCYDSSAKRLAVEALAALQFGKMAFDSTGAHIPAKLVTSTAKDASGLPIGLLPRDNIASMPAPWITAMWETFFTKTTTGNNPSSLGLWIQDKLPTLQSQVTNNTLLSNPVCTAGNGA